MATKPTIKIEKNGQEYFIEPSVHVGDSIFKEDKATQAVAEAGTDNDKFMTPRATKQAIEHLVVDALNSTSTNQPLSANQGKILNDKATNFATSAEAIAGAATDKIMSPNQVDDYVSNKILHYKAIPAKADDSVYSYAELQGLGSRMLMNYQSVSGDKLGLPADFIGSIEIRGTNDVYSMIAIQAQPDDMRGTIYTSDVYHTADRSHPLTADSWKVNLNTTNFASEAEAQAGTATDKIMSPQRVSDWYDANGWKDSVKYVNASTFNDIMEWSKTTEPGVYRIHGFNTAESCAEDKLGINPTEVSFTDVRFEIIDYLKGLAASEIDRKLTLSGYGTNQIWVCTLHNGVSINGWKKTINYKATPAQITAGTDDEKYITSKGLRSQFTEHSQNLLSNNRTATGDSNIGTGAKYNQHYGLQAEGFIALGNNSVGGVIIGKNSTGIIEIGSATGTQSNNKLIAGNKSASFEEIIDSSNHVVYNPTTKSLEFKF